MVDESTRRECNEMIINTELGSFGDKKEIDFIRTDWDLSLDADSDDKGCQIFQKMTSQIHMGEIVRRILLDLAEKHLIFQSQNLERLREPWSFETDFLCIVESDPVGKYDKAKNVLKQLNMRPEKVSPQDFYELRHVCECVTTRGAHLIAVCCVALLKQMDHKDVSIAVAGDFLHLHPYIESMVLAKIKQMMGTDTKVEMFAQDIAKGAVYLAANYDN